MTVNNTTLYFVYNKNSILSGGHVSTFIRSSSGPLGQQIHELSVFQCIVGPQMLTDCYMNVKYISLYILESEVVVSFGAESFVFQVATQKI